MQTVPSRQTSNGTVPCGSPIPPGAICTCNCVPSSRRWKGSIQPLTTALDQVRALRGVRFVWSGDAPPGYCGPDVGFIGEEVAHVIPEVVHCDESGEVQGVDYARLTAVLVEAVKSQQRQIEELQGELECLREQVGAIAE